MVRSRAPRAALLAWSLALALVWGAFAAGGFGPVPVAAATTPHRAAVIVDTGNGVHKVVITFTEDSISGIEALQRAGGSPVIYTFGGQGGAVCRIFGVGRDAGPNCLGGQDGDNRYWAYFRAPAGSSQFTYSSIGAGSAGVRDGDVEGWRFGTGAGPAFVSLASLLPPPPTTPTTRTPVTTPTTRAPSSGSAGSGGPTAPGGVTATPATGPAASGASTTSSTLPVTGPGGAVGTPNAAGRDDAGTDGKDSDRSDTSTDADGKTVKTALASSEEERGGSASSLLWFVLVIAAIVSAVFIVRRVRKQGT